MFLRDGVGVRVDAFAPLQAYGDDGDIDRAGDSDTRPYFDRSFNARLHMSARASSPPAAMAPTYQGRRDTWISDQEVCVWSARYSYESAHLLVEPSPRLRIPWSVVVVLCERLLIGLRTELERCGGQSREDCMKPMRRAGKQL
jgi:hypothetical protein